MFLANTDLELFNQHVHNINATIAELEKYTAANEIDGLKKIRDNFTLKTQDFFRTDRKLNIGVIGQVKAGKSSFLNSLLFDGRPLLPKASTPKTATLTKIEYSETNRMEIEYYTDYEWEEITDNAKVNADGDEFESARELVKMAEQSGIDLHELLAKGKDVIEFESYDALLGNLNDYVGENGQYTAIVKSVVLYMNRDELRGISIVDTPGLNDPIVSRTQRTQEFIEVCDIVFFLSQSGSFLDKSDWSLLSTQLPQKGVKKLVLVASKYDSAIRDVLRHKKVSDDPFDNLDNSQNETACIADAKIIIEQKLQKRAQEQVKIFIRDLQDRGASEEIQTIIANCQQPLLISSICYNMSNKQVSDYDMEENNIYKALDSFSENICYDIALLGDFSAVKKEFEAAISSKEVLFEQKARSFVPISQEEVKNFLNTSKEQAQKRLVILKNSDLQELGIRKQEIEQQIKTVTADISAVLAEVAMAIDQEKASFIKDARRSSSEYTQLSEKVGTQTHYKSYRVSDSKWYNPFSWGRSHTETYSYQESYSYLQATDAAMNIHRYVSETVSNLETIFTKTVGVNALRRKLLKVIVNDFNTGSQNYDAAFFRLLTEETLNNIEFPIIKIEFEAKKNEITARFSGEITNPSEKFNLQQMLSKTISSIFDEIAAAIELEVREFKNTLNNISNKLSSSLLENIQKEFDELCQNFADKEVQIKNLNAYIECIDNELKKS